MVGDGSAYARFRDALRWGDLSAIRAAAAELSRDSLIQGLPKWEGDDPDSARYEQAAARWLARFALESNADFTVLRQAADALETLPKEPEQSTATLISLCDRQTGTTSALTGMELVRVKAGSVMARLRVGYEHLAPPGVLPAGTVITVADSCCGLGCLSSLPEGMAGFTTVELKANFLRPVQAGATVSCTASLAHGGNRTQVWDAKLVREPDDKSVALFRCTQLLLAAW